jgi:hypothetical protein
MFAVPPSSPLMVAVPITGVVVPPEVIRKPQIYVVLLATPGSVAVVAAVVPEPLA